ncbi:alkylation response protein AidB-like acyl-CoA dehydrogenase [Antricoccus suffuscus]|uniref:Alkylation response protein AidB-like acyl-CoA dehydrogenase n=1 Tax=Antricoccus suffuscus TaxID=1629062 RepID=A0A2T1A3G2_9ACTN|nr:acyl-CoA dehydrogenase family protein [Antricoccus suffuscus]PRZ43151.1 alkylation response protein AidB-like acyl-CoA dehydrogenase [Antricoccus suffuscus]
MTTSAELIDRAASLVPVIAKRADDAERGRTLPDETIADLREAELLSALVPRELGGHQLDYRTHTMIARILARGCGSTGWVTSFFGLHAWILSLWPDATVRELFANDPMPLASGPFAPNGKAVADGDGYRLTGRWSWATGVHHGPWVMAGGMIPPPDGHGPPDVRLFLLPTEDVVVHDTWHTDGMRATGSDDVSAAELLVPEDRAFRLGTIREARPAVAAPYGDPIYGWPMVPVLALGAAAPLLGIAEGVLEAYRARLSERVMTYSPGTKQRDVPGARLRLAHATAELHAATLAFDDAVARLDAVRDGAPPPDLAERVRIRWTVAWVVGVCRRVVTELVAGSGASAHRLDSPLQRALRDINTGSGHVVFDQDTSAELFTTHMFGDELPIGSLV